MGTFQINRKLNVPVLLKRFFTEKPDGVKEQDKQQYYVLSIVTYMGLITHFSWIPLFWILGVDQLAALNCFSVTLWLLCILLNRKGYHYLSAILAVFEVLLHQTLCVIIIGWGGGFQYYILFVPTAVFLLPHGRNSFKLSLLFISIINFFILDYLFKDSNPLVALDSSILNSFYYSNLLIFVAVISFITFYATAKINEAEKSLKEEHKKSERLLLNILPQQVAERLKKGSEVIADRFDNVSILFLDIVQFTQRSDRISAKKVVTFLNKLFLIFDDLTEKYDLEKIKTIGDAYMVAAGIPEPCSDHAERLVNMAIDINFALKDYNEQNGEDVKVRIGINSGPAVAGVIGRKKFAYDIWGDTVNTASRMEAYGKPGQIQVSESTYHLLKDKYDFIDRGLINVKGKGDLQAYFLNT